MNWTDALAAEMECDVVTEEAALEQAATDFGRIVKRKPAAKVRPTSARQVARAVRFAASRGLAIGTQGGGHSQSGQSLSEHILLDMTGMDQISSPDPSGGSVRVSAGVRWRALLERLAPLRLSPPVLTNNLDVTVGGTLSTAGLGVASWRHGTQADQVLEMEVVTGEGELVLCSASQNSWLFDAVRAGMGQFGIITSATLRLRRHAPRCCTFYLLYDNLASLLNDMLQLMASERFDYLESWCTPLPQGFRDVGGERQPFARWFYPLHATFETQDEGQPSTQALLDGLHYYQHVHTEAAPIVQFFSRLDPLFALWKRGGFWNYSHPWMECVLSWPATQLYINQVLGNMPPQIVAGGHILMWPARGNASRVPLFMRPQADYLMGFGILPAIPPAFLQEALPRLNLASRAAMMMGGKRYLSGWVDFDAALWAAHYGSEWPRVQQLKRRADPRGILNPGFLKLA